MIFECLPTGMFGSNSYIIGDNGEGIIIDVGVDGDEICEAVEKLGLKIKYIILTHGHIDHVCSVDSIRSRLGAEVLIHEGDSDFLTDSIKNGSYFFGRPFTFNKADRVLKSGDTLEAGGLSFEIIHTPGHTPGCICIKVGNMLFTGDTLFRGSMGRTDLPGGSHEQIIDSIKNTLFKLADDITAYSGHGEESTIGYEKKYNIVVRGLF